MSFILAQADIGNINCSVMDRVCCNNWSANYKYIIPKLSIVWCHHEKKFFYILSTWSAFGVFLVSVMKLRWWKTVLLEETWSIQGYGENDTNFIRLQDLGNILKKTEVQHKLQDSVMKQIHTHIFLVLLIPFSSMSKKFPLIIYMQWKQPVKGENDQHYPAIISPT